VGLSGPLIFKARVGWITWDCDPLNSGFSYVEERWKAISHRNLRGANPSHFD
jgi:hypothetical protein